MGKWSRVPIKNLYSGFWDGPHATPKETDSGPIFLGIKNISEDGHLDFSDIRHISEEEYPRWIKRVEPKPGDIVFTYEATLHRYAIIPEGFRGCLGRRLALIRTNPKIVDTKYLYYYFFSKEWRNTVSKYVILGSTVDRIPIIKFPEFEVDLPPLSTQRRIAEILSAYDDLIEVNTRRIRILEGMAQSVYREMLVETLPAMSPLPEGWEVRPFSELVDIDPATPVDKQIKKPFVGMNALSESSMVINSDLVEMRTGNSGAKFQNRDVLFPRITPSVENGKGAFVQFLKDGQVSIGSTEIIVFREKELVAEYIYFLSREHEFRGNAINSMVGASGRQRVQQGCFDTFLVAKPPKELQQKFSEIVSPMFKITHILAQKNANLRRTRDLLLPRLVGGEVAV